MNCTGPCQQGRKPCPTPESCEQSDGVDIWAVMLALFGAFGLVVCIAMVAVFWPVSWSILPAVGG